jgi:hypothetical protein
VLHPAINLDWLLSAVLKIVNSSKSVDAQMHIFIKLAEEAQIKLYDKITELVNGRKSDGNLEILGVYTIHIYINADFLQQYCNKEGSKGTEQRKCVLHRRQSKNVGVKTSHLANLFRGILS